MVPGKRPTWCTPAQVAGVKPAIPRGKSLGRVLVIVEVASHDAWAPGQQQPLLPIWQVLHGVRIHHAHLCARYWETCIPGQQLLEQNSQGSPDMLCFLAKLRLHFCPAMFLVSLQAGC